MYFNFDDGKLFNDCLVAWPKTIKESYFEQIAEKSTSADIDDVAEGDESNADLSDAMAAYTNAISKTKDIKISK